MKFAPIKARAAKRKGGDAVLQALLPQPKTPAELAAIGDDRYLSQMTACIFRAGFVWKIIENKWPEFETVFSGFNPAGMAALSDHRLEEIARDARIVRNLQKVSTVRENALFIQDIAAEHGSFAQFLANWPTDDIIGLWQVMKKRGKRLGGNSGGYFLRFMGKDTFILSRDVTAALQHADVISTDKPTSQRDLRAIQAAFNAWRQETGLPLCQLSRILACSMDG